jgi:hypothetical protein
VAHSPATFGFTSTPSLHNKGKQMTSKNITITEEELSKASDYIANQFAIRSWWPCEQPGEAKREFDLMKGSSTALNVWCERWLDAGQCKKLEMDLRS